jgi:hypothetical protein
MSTSTDYLTTMLRDTDEEIENLDNSISQLESMKEETDSSTDALTNGVCNPVKNKLSKILEGRTLQFETPTWTYKNEWITGTAYSVNDVVSIIVADEVSATASHYRCIQAHTSSDGTKPDDGATWMSYWDLEILGTAFAVSLGPTYGQISFGNTLTDWAIIDTTTSVPVYIYNGVGWDGNTAITELITDWNFACDYATRPLTQNATYGTQPYSEAMGRALTILTNNKNKISDSQTILTKYAT